MIEVLIAIMCGLFIWFVSGQLVLPKPTRKFCYHCKKYSVIHTYCKHCGVKL